MPDILSKDEIDALLSAEGQKDDGKKKKSKKEEPKGPIVSSYDFKHPARVNRDQLRTLENLHDNFARLLSHTFSSAMRAIVDVDTAFVDQTTYAEFIMSLSNPSLSYQFTVGDTGGQAIMDVAMPVAFGFIDRIYGGRGSSQGVNARQVTPIEIGVTSQVMKPVFENLEATWEPILPLKVSDIELETNPEFMQITAPSEIVILLAFEVNSANASGLVSLCYPFFTLESILPLLGRQTVVRREPGSRQMKRLNNRLLMGTMDVPVVAEVGRAQVPVSAAKGLEVGDVIRLDQPASAPATVFLGGKPKFYAHPFAGGNGEVKLKVAGQVPTHLQGKLGQVS